jgi:signal transduction histidine kinase/ActR/RegA family two-component response regulator
MVSTSTGAAVEHSDDESNSVAQSMLQDIAFSLLAVPEEDYLSGFVAAAGKTMDADMLIVCRILSPEEPVVAFAIYDKSGQATEYQYPLHGTPCENVFVDHKPFVAITELQQKFPNDVDLVEMDLRSYVGVPLMNGDTCIGLVAALWKREIDDPAPTLEVFQRVKNKLRIGVERHNQLQSDRDDLVDELQITSQRLKIALEASKIGVWEWNIETGALIWDQRMKELYGWPSEGPQQGFDDWAAALHPEDAEEALENVRQAVEKKENFIAQFRVVLPSGQVKTIRANGQFLEYPANSWKLIGCNWDVSDDIARSDELERRRLESEHANLAKSQFLANMSHEIRTPLNGVLGMAQLLERTELSDRQAMYAQTIRSSGQTLLDLIDDVLDISKIETGHLALQPDVFHLGEMIRVAADTVAERAKSKGLDFKVDIDSQLETEVVGDQTRIRQVLINLADNAVKFTTAGSVQIAVERRKEDRVRFRVIDTGVGLSTQAVSTIFDRFAQVDNSNTRSFGGAGLGLAISKELVGLAGGELSVTSKLGEGSEFWFELKLPSPAGAPLTQQDRDAATLANAPGARSKVSGRQAARILVVEDMKTNRDVTVLMLEDAGYGVSTAQNGKDALEQMSQNTFDAVLMDIHMPVLSGDEAIRQIRTSSGPSADIPIFVLTADATKGIEDRLLQDGATGYFAKPLNLNDILRRLDDVLGFGKSEITA